MIKRIAAAMALSTVLAGAALAQSATPTETPAQTETPPAPAQAETPTPAEAPAASAPSAAETDTAAAPTSLEDCITAAGNLGQMAEAKTFSDDKLDKLDELFTRMEQLCDAKNFTEAAIVAKDIRTMLDGE